MKLSRQSRNSASTTDRQGSTLLIVLALLSILAFLGMVFFTISSQERAAAEYFSEAAKVEVIDPDDPFPFAMRQLLVGANNRQRNSILHSHDNRHAVITNMVGDDLAPFTGRGLNVAYDTNGRPVIDQDFDNVADTDTSGNQWQNPVNLVDSFAAWGGLGVNEGQLREARSTFAAPDAPYTYPDINNLFLAFRGWAIRDNGSAVADPTLRYERVPVIIPSFMRPALLKSGFGNGRSGVESLTDFDWYDETSHPEYAVRSMRPSALHVSGFNSAGTPIRRFLDATNPAHAAAIAGLAGGSGAFPLRPNEGGNSANFGRLGVWTSDPLIDPGAPLPPIDGGIPNHFADTFELDSDNDDDGIKEGIWMDLSYPVEVTAGGISYITLFSFTIYDLDSLHDLNVHGNMAHLDRSADVPSLVGSGNALADKSISASNLGLSPTEISPVRALFPTGPNPDAETNSEFTDWYDGATPFNRREQANMELMWLLTGRIESDPVTSIPHEGPVHVGKWGDAAALWYHKNGAGGELISTLPRPGRSGNLAQASSGPVGFGGRQGFDDNRNLDEGIATVENGRVRGFNHPLDVSGRGYLVFGSDPRNPYLFNGNDPTRANRWLRYTNYSLVGSTASLFNDSAYVRGLDGDFSVTVDNLVENAAFNFALDDPTEVIFDNDQTLRPDDAIFGSGDMIPAHLSSSDLGNPQTSLSTRLADLSPHAFSGGSTIKERFTTITNSLRYIPFPHQLGPNKISNNGSVDDGPRWWEWTADADTDGKFEFPPQFGAVTPYSQNDPFRAVTRRLLTTEVGDRTALLGQLPLSLNHILDVNRGDSTPPETSPRFFNYLMRSGMKFRSLTEHPDASETDGAGGRAAALTSVPVSGTAAGDSARNTFPPTTLAAREFWARRDRQQMARDMYVLLYTLGGAEIDGGTGNVVDYRVDNSGRAAYTNEQLRRMAQFAVNLVDGMDTDNVITKFEYDKNLNNGWGLDDDAYTDDGFAVSTDVADTGDGMYPEDSATDRGVVYGVESQQVAFSEALAVYSAKVDPGNNLIETEYDDEVAQRIVLHVELQNTQPFPAVLTHEEVGTTNKEHAVWRMLRVDRAAPTAAQDDTPNYEFSLMHEPTLPAGESAIIPAGEVFTIGIASLQGTPADADPLGFGTADLYVDDDSDGNFNLISPDIDPQANTVATGATPNPKCNLDTVQSPTPAIGPSFSLPPRFLANGVGDGGQFLEGIVTDLTTGTLTEYHGNDAYGFPAVADASNGGFDLVLQRRQNPNLPNVPLSENPFVEVDRIGVELRHLIATPTATPSIQLDELKSLERREPLDATSQDFTAHEAVSATNWRRNSIGALMNDVTDGLPLDGAGVFNRWQAHFDRDYASPAELLNLPIVPQKLYTHRMNRMRFSAARQVHTNPTTAVAFPGSGETRWISSAEAMFLLPEFPDSLGTTENDNRWYRLLQFVEVPSRLNTMLGNYLNLYRTPGKLNINGLRHVDVYAGLLDNEVFAELPYNRDPNTASPFDQDNRYAPFMRDTTPAPAPPTTAVPGIVTGFNFRDRWFEFCQERDGVVNVFDPLSGGNTNFWIPGTPNARPFRPFSFSLPDVTTAADDNAIAATLLRRFGSESGVADNNRNWLEVGDSTFHQNPLNANSVLRHQLLSKVWNNTTTTSNAFIVYGTAAYFEVHEDAVTGLVQVGGRLDLDGDTVAAGVSADISTGWEQRSVFIIDRTEAYNAFDPASGSFDWQRLIRSRADLSPTDK